MIRNLLTTIAHRYGWPFRALAVCLLVSGIGLIQTASDRLLIGALVSLAGGALLLAMPAFGSAPAIRGRWIYICGLLLAGALLLRESIFVFNIPGQKLPNYQWGLSAWVTALGLFIAGMVLWDRRRTIARQQSNTTDTLITIGIFLLSFALRGWQIVERSPVNLSDEQEVFGETIRLVSGYRPNPLGTSPLAFPWLYHWIMFLVWPLVNPVVDLFLFTKLTAAAAAAISVAAWFALVRLYSSRVVAACTAIMLAFSSWHWINSRFLYMYPFDLALVALSTYFLCAGIRSGSLWRIFVAGVISGLSIVSQKIAIMTVPFGMFVLADAWLFGAKERRRQVYLFTAVWGAGVALTYLPFLLYYLNIEWLPRQSQILRDKTALLEQYGATPTSAFFHLVGDIFYQLYVAAFDQARHMIREGKGLLDPVQCGLFLVGGLAAVFAAWKSSPARLCIVGLFVFAMPMVLSFPVDSRGYHGVPRRMLASIFFICWLSAQGAEALCQRLLPATKVGFGILALAATSAVINVWYVFAYYVPMTAGFPFIELRDVGIQKAAMLTSIRTLARNAVPVLVLGDSPNLAFKYALGDLGNVTVHKTTEELRESILNHRGKYIYVVIPGNDLGITAPYQGTPATLADIVPTYLWMGDGMNIHANPAVRYAFLKVAEQ
jgi:hypothetical protein